MPAPLRSRLARVLSELRRDDRPAALLLGNAPRRTRSRDTNYPYRADSDFFYLTGSSDPELTLLVHGPKKQVFLLAPPIDKATVLWEGRPPSRSALAESLNAELVVTKDTLKKLREYLNGVANLYANSHPGTLSGRVVQLVRELSSHARGPLPSAVIHSDRILAPMRMVKDRHELSEIKRALKVTWDAFQDTLPLIRPGSYEYEIAARLEYGFRTQRCEPAFETIVGAGRSAATLHYTALSQRLRRGQMVLIDFGAELNGYAADITRAVPVDDQLSIEQRDVYEVVLAAQRAAIRKVRAGVRVRSVHDASVKVLTEGLKELGVLRGKTENLIKKRKYYPYYPHGVGHSLGLDTHDIGPHRGDRGARLEAGMVFTVEPGLYFRSKAGKIPPCGVRIEDDVAVTENGAEILSKQFPKELDAILELKSAVS